MDGLNNFQLWYYLLLVLKLCYIISMIMHGSINGCEINESNPQIYDNDSANGIAFDFFYFNFHLSTLTNYMSLQRHREHLHFSDSQALRYTFLHLHSSLHRWTVSFNYCVSVMLVKKILLYTFICNDSLTYLVNDSFQSSTIP